MPIIVSTFHGRHLKSVLALTVIAGIIIWIIMLNLHVDFHTKKKNNNYFKELNQLNTYVTESPNDKLYGEGGKPVNEFSKKKFLNETNEAYRIYGFNQFVSDKISPNRSLPDFRYASCKNIRYAEKLPTVSVIIVFYDEGQSTLYRTVYSVLNRSPPELIHEIILVDDFSTLEHLKTPLDKWVETFKGKVKILRLKTHDGLITAKNAGAAVSTGEVFIFLDSHCEATIGWLPPLLSPIVNDYKVVTAPIIDVIGHETFEYVPIYNRVRGTFSWIFYYKERNEKPQFMGSKNSDNIKSPVMAGGLFAISKRWWHEIGEYDPELYAWGGEQYEISFKIWMCGGALLNVPCSHVGHIYRGPGLERQHQGIHTRHPNSFNTNHKRVAEVWMDEYKHFLYMNHKGIANADVGMAIDVRKKLRESLQCKSFRWYLENVIKDTLNTRYEPDLGYGEVTSTVSKNQMCICQNGLNQPLSYKSCRLCPNGWRYTWIGEFKEDEHCWDYHKQKSLIYNIFCHENRGNQYFKYDKNSKKIRVASMSNKCVAASKINQSITVLNCDENNPDYVFEWKVNLLDNSHPPDWSSSALHPPRPQ